MRAPSYYLPRLLTSLILWSLALSACAGGGRDDDAVRARVAVLTSRAAKAEPSTTGTLKELAKQLDGEMLGLQWRLKTSKSMTRKIKTRLLKSPDLAAKDVQITDALRYTMRFEDSPSGHHVRSVKATLQALEARGHTVVKVKNYWPRGDNYSGTNSVLMNPAGLPWELQFHTSGSYKVQKATRAQYEELRADGCQVARKRELFLEMAKLWESVPVPAGILEPGSLHPKQKIIQIPEPK